MPLQPTPGVSAEAQIDQGGWWPTIDLAKLRACCRIDGTVTPERLRAAVVSAALSVNAELDDWSTSMRLASGCDSLAATNPKTIDNQPINVAHYLRAVSALTMAELCDRYREYDATQRGAQRAAIDIGPTSDDYRRDARWAISDITGRRRTTVELI